MPRNTFRLILAFASTTILSANVFANSAMMNDRVVIRGEAAKELYDAMKSDGTIVRTAGGNPARSLLNGKLFCAAVVERGLPRGDWRCTIEMGLEPFEIEHIFRHLDVKPITTSAFHRNVKIVGDIIFMSSFSEKYPDLNTEAPIAEDNKIFYTHPCKGVTTLAGAKKCMKFWAKEIFQEYNLTNDSLVVTTNEETLSHLKNALNISGYNERAITKALQAAKQSKYLSVIGEYQDEVHLLYMSLSKNNVMAPIQIDDLNTVDIDWSAMDQIFSRPRTSDPQAIKKYYNEKATCALLLGQKPSARGGFEVIKEVVTDGIESLD